MRTTPLTDDDEHRGRRAARRAGGGTRIGCRSGAGRGAHSVLAASPIWCHQCVPGKRARAFPAMVWGVWNRKLCAGSPLCVTIRRQLPARSRFRSSRRHGAGNAAQLSLHCTQGCAPCPGLATRTPEAVQFSRPGILPPAAHNASFRAAAMHRSRAHALPRRWRSRGAAGRVHEVKSAQHPRHAPRAAPAPACRQGGAQGGAGAPAGIPVGQAEGGAAARQGPAAPRKQGALRGAAVPLAAAPPPHPQPPSARGASTRMRGRFPSVLRPCGGQQSARNPPWVTPPPPPGPAGGLAPAGLAGIQPALGRALGRRHPRGRHGGLDRQLRPGRVPGHAVGLEGDDWGVPA